MKKNLLVLMLLGMVVMPAMAAAACDPAIPATCPAPNVTFVNAVNTILNLIFWAIMIISIVYLMIAAYSFITSSGESAKMATATNAVRNAIIGLIVAVMAKGIAIYASGLFQ